MNTKLTAAAMVCNGRAATNVGYRQVVLTPRGVARPVHRVVASGCHVSDMATYQKPREGDLLLRCQWWPELHTISELIDHEWVDLGIQGFATHSRVISSIDPALTAFLLPLEHVDSSHLPIGCGWDGVSTVASRRKEMNIRRLMVGLDDVRLDEIVALAHNSTYRDLPDNWTMADPMPAVLEPGACAGRPWEYILWYSDGRVESIIPDGHGITPMADVARIVRLKRGYHTRGDKPFGIAWDMYKRDGV